MIEMIISMIFLIGFVFLIALIAIFMNNAKVSAKDFFLHLGTMVGLFTVAISFINLLFKIINKILPEVGASTYAWGAGSQISMPVATLIVFFPIFIILSRMVHRIYEREPEKKDIWIRKWLTYITLFVAGIALAADLVTVIYKFLDGQDLTGAFLLKALTVLLVTGAVFWFYVKDLKDGVSAKSRKIYAIILAVVILMFIIIGFSVFGSPRAQKLIRYDTERLEDLQNLQWQVINYWQTEGFLPQSLDEMALKARYIDIPADPQTGEPYKYRNLGNMTFELCATFNKESSENNLNPRLAMPVYEKDFYLQNSDWSHGAGEQCFERYVDPEIYPTQIRG
jgi:hypothetical protein